jgi:radical SAM protein with 4Fe4S-binding SPASM domain
MFKTNSKDKLIDLEKLSFSQGYVHPKYGDLLDHQAVKMPPKTKKKSYFKDSKPYFVHLSITNKCNAKCRGCVNWQITDANFRNTVEDTDPVRDAKAISKIISRIKSEVVICLYGGEPLLETEKIKVLLSEIEKYSGKRKIKYMLYTNGILLDKALEQFKEVLDKLWMVSVSIDGSAKQHEKVRPGLKMNRIRKNLKGVKANLGTSTLMWSTIREGQSLRDCFDEFMRLHRKGYIDYFFWHWVETQSPFIDFGSFLNSYEKDLHFIMKKYVLMLEKDNIVLPITHINELLLYLFTGKSRNSTSCAVERKRNYDILGGKIYPCADLPKEYLIGTIDQAGKPNITNTDFSALIEYKQYLGCKNCGVGKYCGGRCPVQALTASNRRLVEYCQLMRLHVAIVGEYKEKIQRLLSQKHYSLQQVYDQSVFVNQFTDVTP